MQYINLKVRSTIKWHGRKFSAVRGEILQPVWFLFENYLQKIDEIRISIAIQITLPFLGYQFYISFDMRRDEETNLEKKLILCKFNWIETRNSQLISYHSTWPFMHEVIILNSCVFSCKLGRASWNKNLH